jgi:hypothetical protein
VDGREAGQLLLAWSGEKLRKVWEAGRARGAETFWFELEDLDQDGVAEVIGYRQRALDVYRDEEFREESGGGEGRTMGSGQVDPQVVRRLVDGRWKKDPDLLKALR